MKRKHIVCVAIYMGMMLAGCGTKKATNEVVFPAEGGKKEAVEENNRGILKRHRKMCSFMR